MKENVFLIFAINEKRKEKQQLLMNIEICKQGVPLGSGADNLTNEQQKEIELQELQIQNLQQEIIQLEEENEQLQMRRPNDGYRLPPLQGDP